jgi:ABC-type Na+ transport system ATPase subunit NatA
VQIAADWNGQAPAAWYNPPIQGDEVEAAVSLRGLRKTFGSMTAVDNLNLAIPRGALYGFIGPSGAGKTTCIRLIMSILFPDAGELSVLGRRSALEAKDRIGYLPEERGVYRKMKVGAFLAYLGQLKGVSPEDAGPRAAQLLARLGLQDVEKKKCEDLSKGMLQRVQFVGAIINQPDLIILDEPFGGLDPVSVRLLKELIADEHRRDDPVLHARHGPRRGDVPAHRDDSQGPQGPRRADGRPAAAVRHPHGAVRAPGGRRRSVAVRAPRRRGAHGAHRRGLRAAPGRRVGPGGRDA